MKMVKEQCGTVKLNPTIVRKSGKLVRNPSTTVTHPRAFELIMHRRLYMLFFPQIEDLKLFPKIIRELVHFNKSLQISLWVLVKILSCQNHFMFGEGS